MQHAPSSIFRHRPRFVYCWINCAICQQYQIAESYTVDNHLSFGNTSWTWLDHYHIRSLRYIRPLIDREKAVNLACSTVTSRLDNCNSVL